MGFAASTSGAADAFRAGATRVAVLADDASASLKVIYMQERRFGEDGVLSARYYYCTAHWSIFLFSTRYHRFHAKVCVTCHHNSVLCTPANRWVVPCVFSMEGQGRPSRFR